MNETNFFLSRGDASTLLRALEQYAVANTKAAAHTRKNTRPQPGVASSYHIVATEALMLRRRVLELMADKGWIPEAK